MCTVLWAEGHTALESKGGKYERWSAAKERTVGSKEIVGGDRTLLQGQAKGTHGGHRVEMPGQVEGEPEHACAHVLSGEKSIPGLNAHGQILCAHPAFPWCTYEGKGGGEEEREGGGRGRGGRGEREEEGGGKGGVKEDRRRGTGGGRGERGGEEGEGAREMEKEERKGGRKGERERWVRRGRGRREREWTVSLPTF